MKDEGIQKNMSTEPVLRKGIDIAIASPGYTFPGSFTGKLLYEWEFLPTRKDAAEAIDKMTDFGSLVNRSQYFKTVK